MLWHGIAQTKVVKSILFFPFGFFDRPEFQGFPRQLLVFCESHKSGVSNYKNRLHSIEELLLFKFS